MTKITDASIKLTKDDYIFNIDYIPIGRIGSNESMATNLFELKKLFTISSYIQDDNIIARVTKGVHGFLSFEQDTTTYFRFYNDKFEPFFTNQFDIGTSSKKIKDLYISGSIEFDTNEIGDIYYRNENNKFTRLPIGTENYVLTSINGLPAWVDATNSIQISNIGSGVGLYKGYIDNYYQFKTLVSNSPELSINIYDDTIGFLLNINTSWGDIGGDINDQSDLIYLLSLKQNSINNGSIGQYYSWDKTWRQIDYSHIINVPNLDLSNYVTIDSSQTISGEKIFTSNYTYFINPLGTIFRSQTNGALFRLTTTGMGQGYTGTLELGALTNIRTWNLPDDSGTIALTKNLLFNTTVLNSRTYIKPVTNSNYLAIGNPSYNWGNEVLLLKAYVGYSSSTALSFFEKDYENWLFRVTHDGTITAGRGIDLGGSNTVGRRVSAHPYVKWIFPSSNNRSVTLWLNSEPSQNISFYLPTSDGTSGQVLTTNGLGQWSWGTVSGGGSYSVFTNTVSGLVPAPNSGSPGSKFLRDDATWQTISSGIVTYLRLNSGIYRSGELTLQTITNNAVTITESTPGVFTISHVDTSSISNTSTSNFNIISSLNFDDFGHVTSINTRSLLPDSSNGYFLRDDGQWVPVSGGEGGGTITSVSAGLGMNFTTITTSGAVTLGIPSWIGSIKVGPDSYQSSSNSVSAGTHSHEFKIPEFTILYGGSGNTPAFLPFPQFVSVLSASSYNNITWYPYNFVSLTDTPSNYVGHNGKYVAVKSDGSGLEFVTLPSGTSHNPVTASIINATYVSFVSNTQAFTFNKISVSDINATGISNTKFLRGDGTWQEVSGGGIGQHSLVDSNVHTDIFITNLQANQVLLWTGNSWVNYTLPTYTDTYLQSVIGNGNSIVTFTLNNGTTVSANFTHSHSEYISGNYVKSFNGRYNDVLLLKSDIEAVLTGLITSHTHNYTNNTGTVEIINGSTSISVSGNPNVNPTLSVLLNFGLEHTSNGISVKVGTTSDTLAVGNHTHSQLHNRSHSITSSLDHTAPSNSIFYSDENGVINSIGLGSINQILVSKGLGNNPEFVNFTSFNTFSYGSKGLVPDPGASRSDENRFLRADGTWSIPQGSGTGMTNPMTDIGDIIYRSNTSNPDRLGIGSVNQVLMVKNISGNLLPRWETLTSTFVLNVTGDVSIPSNQISVLNPEAISSKNTYSSNITNANLLLLNTSTNTLNKISAINLRNLFYGFTQKGQLITYDGTNPTLLNGNSFSDRRVLTSYNNSGNILLEWFVPVTTVLQDMPQSITTGHILYGNAGKYESRTPAILLGGVGINITNTFYSILSATNPTISVVFGGTGSSNSVARADHTHTISAFTINPNKLIGRRPGAPGQYQMEEISIGATGSNAIFLNANEIYSRLENETAPTLSSDLLANSKNIQLVNNIIPRLQSGSPIANLGSLSNKFNDVWTAGKIYIGNTSIYYAGDSLGRSNYDEVSSNKIIIKNELVFVDNNNNTVMILRLSGNDLAIINSSGQTKIRLQQDGNAIFKI